MKRDVCGVILIALMCAAGCGGGDGDDGGDDGSAEKGTPGGGEQQAADPNAFPAARATATIAGKILFDGDPPAREAVPKETIAAAKDEFCELHHKDTPVWKEDLVVGEDKGIRNVLVYVKKFPQEWTHTTLTETVKIDQQNCTYIPHVVGAMVNQPVVITSSDDTAHNVHFMAKMNRIRKGNVTLAKGESMEVQLKRPEIGSAYFKCDIHGWMKSYVNILDHPFFIVTSDDGSFELGKLPPGEYEIEAWHETLGTQTASVTLADGETTAADFTFKAK